MIQMLVATLMWALVASLLIFRRRRTDRSITYAALTIAIAMTLNIDAAYSAVDQLLGGTNLTTLISDALLMTGLFFLGRGVMKTGQYRPQFVRAAVSVPILLVALLALTTVFLVIDRGTTTTRFMIDLGAQPAAAVYSIINFTYCLIIVIAMLVLATRQYRHSTGIQRLPAALLSAGSAFGVALCLDVVGMDLSHTTGHLTLMHAFQIAYDLLTALTFLFLCAGFAVQPAVRRAQHHARRRQTIAFTAQLEPIWLRATHARPGLSQANPLATHSEDPEGHLHRMIVEVRDAMIDPRITFDISANERDLLEGAECHLIGTDNTATEAPPEPGIKERRP